MKVLVLDPYPKRPWRISKDTSGGYGTANRFGDGLVSGIITKIMAREVDWPPLYSVHTAGVLANQGHEVEYARQFDGKSNYDLCLVTSSIVCHETELKAVKKVVAEGIPVGVIGPLATNVSEPYVKAGAFVILGEPEMYFLNNPIETGTLSSLSGTITSGESVSLDDLPLPAWELVFQSAPPKFGLLGGGRVMLPIAATRGCPYSCSHYCVYPLQQGNKVRLRDPQKIVKEMEHWSDTLGITYFIFRDPVFSINRKHTMKLCEALKQSSYKFKFMIETHLNNMDEELATRLQELGLEMVKVGIEATSKETIQQSKRFSIEQDEQVKRIRMLEKLGVKITSFYILGLPGDTPDSFQKTMKYAQKLNSVFAQISVFTPYPGTPAFSEYKDKIVVDEYENFTQYDLVFKHKMLSPKQIRKMLSRAYRDYYLRPRWIFKYLAARFT